MESYSNSDIAAQFGNNVRTIRKMRKLTQQNLSDICGYSQKTLSDIERGVSDPRLSTIVDLADG